MKKIIAAAVMTCACFAAYAATCKNCLCNQNGDGTWACICENGACK